MRIKRFEATGVHGYMNFNIEFNDDLTFLTGINGSGKTTVVKGISALITPSLINLAYTQYERMEVEIHEIEIDGSEKEQVKIWSVKNQGEFMLATSETKKELVLQVFPPDITAPLNRIEERGIEYYHEMRAEHANHPVMKLLRSMPSPMLLGIERRTIDSFDPSESRRVAHYKYRSSKFFRAKTVFGSSLSASLQEAIELAEKRFREVAAQQRQLTEILRKNILSSALKYEKSGPGMDFRLHWSPEDTNTKKSLMLDTLEELGLTREEFEPNLTAFFNDLQELSELAKSGEDFQHLLESGTTEERTKIIQLAVNFPQFDRINKIMAFVESYIKNSREENKPIDRYLKIVNDFFKDSNKRLCFDETGALSIMISDSDPTPTTSLSSGESQIIVIITHLSFNPAAQLANVFIVDEPELSLHLRWQELFVQSIREANPNLQVILATHSPSIILDNVDYGVDLSKGVQ